MARYECPRGNGRVHRRRMLPAPSADERRVSFEDRRAVGERPSKCTGTIHEAREAVKALCRLGRHAAEHPPTDGPCAGVFAGVETEMEHGVEVRHGAEIESRIGPGRRSGADRRASSQPHETERLLTSATCGQASLNVARSSGVRTVHSTCPSGRRRHRRHASAPPGTRSFATVDSRDRLVGLEVRQLQPRLRRSAEAFRPRPCRMPDHRRPRLGPACGPASEPVMPT